MGAVTVVFDTNVLVSALGFGGTPLDALLSAITDRETTIAATDETLDELSRVLAYDRLPITPADRTTFLSILEREVDLVRPTASVDAIERDPDDNVFLECAVAADADYLVSGDDHLLELGTFRATRIVTPAAFLELRESDGLR